MKKLYLSLLLFFNLIFVFAQEPNKLENFKFDQKERTVTWIKVFEIKQNISLSDLKDYFVENKIIDIKEQKEDSFSGDFFKRVIDLQKYGYSRSTTPIGIIDAEIVFRVRIEIKEGKYRAVLTEMGHLDNGRISAADRGNLESYNGEYSFTNKNEVRTRINLTFEILDAFYSDVLEYKVKNENSKDW
jgi:hypothetical protein